MPRPRGLLARLGPLRRPGKRWRTRALLLAAPLPRSFHLSPASPPAATFLRRFPWLTALPLPLLLPPWMQGCRRVTPSPRGSPCGSGSVVQGSARRSCFLSCRARRKALQLSSALASAPRVLRALPRSLDLACTSPLAWVLRSSGPWAWTCCQTAVRATAGLRLLRRSWARLRSTFMRLPSLCARAWPATSSSTLGASWRTLQASRAWRLLCAGCLNTVQSKGATGITWSGWRPWRSSRACFLPWCSSAATLRRDCSCTTGAKTARMRLH